MNAWVKRFALRWTPPPLLHRLRAWHHRRVLRGSLEALEPDLIVVRQLVSAGDTVIDVGANYGIYTKFLSDLVGINGKVLSLEPIPETFAILAQNVRYLGLGNVTLFDRAASDVVADVKMIVPSFPGEGSNYYQARIVSEEAPIRTSSRTIHATTLDMLTDRGTAAITFVKCDVEGHEAAVLRGAEKVLTNQQPALLLEVSGNPDEAGSPAAELLGRLKARGYACYRRQGRTLVARQPGDRSVNYFFLQPPHLALLDLDSPS